MKSVRLSFFLPLALLFQSCSSLRQVYQPSRKLSPQQSIQDLTLLQSILEANHPSLYWYTTRDSINRLFTAARTSITDSLTDLQFKNKVAMVIDGIHCGHTAVRSSKSYTRYYSKKRSPQFPLSVKVWGDSMIVVSNSLKQDSIFKRGTVITGINGYNNRRLLDSMFHFISTDGFTNNFKQQVISFNFPYYYNNTFGFNNQYRINYIDDHGQSRTAFVKNFQVQDTGRKKQIDSLPAVSNKVFRHFRLMTSRSLLIDTSISTAILKVNTFSGGRLNAFFKKSFKKIKTEGVKNLVVDIRENGGGDIMSSTRLTQYLIDHPFHIADTVAAINRSFPYKKYIKPWFLYWLSMHFTGRKHSDGRIHFNYFENHYFKARKENHFNGKIYIVAGGYSFSAATLFAGALKGQQNVTLVGEETGGGSYGNTAMHLPVVTLPNSRVRIVMPLYRIVVDRNRPKTGRGIFPDIEVKPSGAAIKRGADAKMEKVHDLIIKGQ